MKNTKQKVKELLTGITNLFHDKKKLLYTGGALIAFITIIACGIYIIRYTSSNKKEIARLEAIREDYIRYTPTSQTPVEEPEEEAEPAPATIEVAGYSVPYQQIDFTALRENQNSDIYAWISIPGSAIDYPIVQHPTDNSYYIGHNLNGSSGYPGCIYTENYNSTTWDDTNTIIYGHNMKNGTMFAGLHKYEDATFFEENPYVYIYSENYVRIYQIFAAYTFNNQHVYTLCDWDNPRDVSQYQSDIFNNAGNFDKTITLDGTQKMITLSTCIRNRAENRFLVQAVLVGEGELEGQNQ